MKVKIIRWNFILRYLYIVNYLQIIVNCDRAIFLYIRFILRGICEYFRGDGFETLELFL